MFYFDTQDCAVTRYGYREMIATDRFLDISYQAGDGIAQLKQELADVTTGGPDNHEVYVLTRADGRKIALQFSDWHLYIGADIRPRGY